MRKEGLARAFGELLVIVAGVLIALIAENQWSEFKSRAEARGYLTRLASEAQSNREWIDDDVDWSVQACTSAQAMLKYARNPGTTDQDPAELLRYAVSAAMHADGEADRATYDDLVNTGRLSLITDSDLRRTISAAYAALEMRETWRPRVDDSFRMAVLRTLPLHFVEQVLDECVRVEGTQSASAVLRDCEALPNEGIAEEWLAKLVEHPDLEGDLSERVYGVCRFDDQSAYARAIVDSMAVLVEADLR